MRIRDAFGVYNVLENAIKKAKGPLTCVDLYDDLQVQKFADSPSRVSDYLGHMYRQGLLGRTTAPKTANSQARYAYYWKNRSEVTAAAAPAQAQPEPSAPSILRSILKKPSIEIFDDGSTVVIDLPALSITIRSKNL